MSAAPARLSQRQRVAWLRLSRTANVGPATFRDLVNRFGSAAAAIEALPGLMQRSGSSRFVKIPTDEDAEAELEAIDALGGRLIAIGEADYPAMLRTMEAPPPLVTVRGDPAIFARPALAIVGARNASLAGQKLARRLAAEIGAAGYAIVSGLARGIDTAAHLGSLESGTVGVFAGGLDRPYPPENIDLIERIVERGAVISEMPVGWEPRARDFPRRNRLIAGGALGLLVIEAARQSGSLITARLAGEMGRLVFAVPGSPLDPRSEGTNALIKDGATLVTESNDVIEGLRPLSPHATPSAGLSAGPVADFEGAVEPAASDRTRLLEALGPTPSSIDELVAHTRLNPAQVFTILLELDLEGRLERHAGGNVSLVYS